MAVSVRAAVKSVKDRLVLPGRDADTAVGGLQRAGLCRCEVDAGQVPAGGTVDTSDGYLGALKAKTTRLTLPFTQRLSGLCVTRMG